VKVLLVDDTPEIAELLGYALRDRGHDVVATNFITDINELVDHHHAEAVVLDCSVFNMSESLFDSLRNDPNHASLPVVIVSDTPEQADASLRRRNAHHVMLIPKPFTGSQIARALEELVTRET
jgi:DNA-binding response OmpR family regulator